MITVRNLAVRAARRLTQSDLNEDAQVAQEVLEAINFALYQFYQIAPDTWSETLFEATLEAPRSVGAGTFAEARGKSLTSELFDPSEVGSTVRIQGDISDNLITGPDCVFRDWPKDDLSFSDATVYHDAIPIEETVTQTISELDIHTNGQQNRSAVRVQEGAKYWRSGQDAPHGIAGGYHNHHRLSGYGMSTNFAHRQVGIPNIFWIDSVGASAGASSAFFLRIDPMPNQLIQVSWKAEQAPKTLTMQNILGNIQCTIPIHQQQVETMLFPLALAQLAKGEYWENDKTRQVIIQEGVTAEKRIKEHVTSNMGYTETEIVRPFGF